MRKEKIIVKEFYDDFGWSKNRYGVYNDTEVFVDGRPVLRSYQHKVIMRTKKFLKTQGEYFLDAGSGATAYLEYFEYSSNYKWHVCVDISVKALMETKCKLRERGLYVLADLTQLPFKNGVFDSIMCAHVLYHIPQDEQESTVHELYRALKINGNCLIVYSWPTSISRKASVIVNRIKKYIVSQIELFSYKKKPKTDTLIEREENQEKVCRPPLYVYKKNYSSLQSIFPDSWVVEMRCWSSVDTQFTKTFVIDNMIGQLLMKLLYWMESIFPHALTRICAYPMIIIRKRT